MDAGRCDRPRIKNGGDARERGVWIGRDQARDRTRARRLRIEHDSRGARLFEHGPQFRIREERDGASMRGPEARDAVDTRIRIAAKLAAETDCELSERDRHVRKKKAARVR